MKFKFVESSPQLFPFPIDIFLKLERTFIQWRVHEISFLGKFVLELHYLPAWVSMILISQVSFSSLRTRKNSSSRHGWKGMLRNGSCCVFSALSRLWQTGLWWGASLLCVQVKPTSVLHQDSVESMQSIDSCEYIWEAGVGFAQSPPLNYIHDLNR